MEKIEFLILRNLIFNEDYSRKVIPFLKDEYFEDSNQKIIFQEISNFIQKYNKLATKEILFIEIENRNDINESSFKEILDIVNSFEDEVGEIEWLLDSTEKWCRDRAIYLALMDSIHIADGKDSKKNRDAIPSILSEALSVSFDNHIGHDYLQDYEERFESYHRKEDRIPFDLEYFNKITKGGLPSKTLNIALAQVLESLYSCVMWQAVSLSKVKTSSTSLLKWQRRKLRKGLMLIYLMSIYKT
tara:strand:- start:336 stop:1067 length:732 start_codon:yes stop_codon:yes gene_type:complete